MWTHERDTKKEIILEDHLTKKKKKKANIVQGVQLLQPYLY